MEHKMVNLVDNGGYCRVCGDNAIDYDFEDDGCENVPETDIPDSPSLEDTFGEFPTYGA